MGALGLTGRDLNLKYTPLTSKDGLYADDEVYPEHSKYILEILPQAPAKKYLSLLRGERYMPMSWMMVLFHYELLHFCIWIGEAYTKSRKLGKK